MDAMTNIKDKDKIKIINFMIYLENHDIITINHGPTFLL